MSRDVRQTGRGGVRRVEKSNLGRKNCYTKPERLECAWFQKGEESTRGQMARAGGRYGQGAGNAKPQLG